MSGKSSFVLIISFTFIFLCSCTNNSKNNLESYEILNEGLNNSNQTIDRASRTIYVSLQQKLNDPGTNYKAIIWYPKATRIQALSKDIITYMEDLKTELKKEAGLTIKNEQESFGEDNINAVNQIFQKKAKGDELYSRLMKYK
jgi:hypothetical protein